MYNGFADFIRNGIKGNEAKTIFVDAESDGLYGPFLTVAIIITNLEGEELERFYYGICKDTLAVKDIWTRKNVLSVLGEYTSCENEQKLLEKVWAVWETYREEAYVVADVMYPVEARLFQRCVEQNADRKLEAPFPLLDLSSMLWTKGIDPLAERERLAKIQNRNRKHNALYDVEVAIEIYKKYILEVNN